MARTTSPARKRNGSTRSTRSTRSNGSTRTAAQKSAAARAAWKTRRANGWVHPGKVKLTKRQRALMEKGGLSASQASKL
jgi:hypothetical protein